jgi:hypothetical protein
MTNFMVEIRKANRVIMPTGDIFLATHRVEAFRAPQIQLMRIAALKLLYSPVFFATSNIGLLKFADSLIIAIAAPVCVISSSSSIFRR